SWAVKSLTMVLYFWDFKDYNIARRGQDPSNSKKEETKVAKKAKGGKPTKTKGAKTITVKDLQAEYPQLQAHQIRQVIRSLGLRAPELKGVEGFGPRRKYEWDSDDEDLKKIRKALDDYIASREESAASEEDEEPEEDEDSEDDEDEDEDEEEDEE